ncbi:MAG: phosphohistidine phosphatase SixA [Bacteroidales bacterium]|nr:phosphohistidine phosphatase SixA [Bacteroidales bacterium]
MKKLFIMRHGKAEDGFDKADYKRKLVSKGIKRSQKIAQNLAALKPEIDCIVHSNALRAKETAEIIAKELNLTEIKEAQELYLAPVIVLMDFFYALENSISNVLLVGHNPGLSEFITHLSGKFIDWLPTSTLVALEIDTNLWEEIGIAPVKITLTLHPKE